MGELAVYAAVPLIFAALCIRCRGGLSKCSGFLKERCFSQLPVSRRLISRCLMIVLAADALAAAVCIKEGQEDTARQGYLVRDGLGGISYETELKFDDGENEGTVTLEVEPVKYTAEEAAEILQAAAAEAFDRCLAGQDPLEVRADLNFVESSEEYPVDFFFITGDSEAVGWDGTLSDALPEEGTEVEIALEARFGGETEEELQEEGIFKKMTVVVYPKAATEEEALRREIRDAVGSEDAASERVSLPDSVGGKAVEWSKASASSGATVLFLGVAAAVFLLLSQQGRQERKKQARREELMRGYPALISKLVLYLGAGVSVRNAFIMMGEGYAKSLQAGGRTSPALEEAAICAAELRKNLPEEGVYLRFGERTGLPHYRTLASLLVQNLKRGNGAMLAMLENEAAEAFDERRKEARARGEKAGAKLVFPMLVMFGIILVICVVPAFTTM